MPKALNLAMTREMETDPWVRIGFVPITCTVTRVLENMFYPSAEHIVRAAESLLGIPEIDLSNEVFNEYKQRFKGHFKGV